MGLNTSKYQVQKNGGLGGLFRTITSAPDRAASAVEDWGQVLVYGGVIAGAGLVLMVGYSFASGRQNLAATVSAAGDIAKSGAKLTPMGRAASMVV